MREEMGLPKTSIARKIGKTIQSYTAKEDGKQLFNLQETYIISQMFNREIEEIFLNPIQ